jgi:hypothetical protein
MGWQVRNAKGQAGFNAAYIVLGLVVLLSAGLIGFLILNSQPAVENGLVPLKNPESGKPAAEAAKPGDGVPEGFKAYTNAQLGFSFAYPSAWGDFTPVAGSSALLELTTPKVAGYSLADSLQLQVETIAKFRIRANDTNTIVQPVANGAGYDWVITDKGSGKQTVGKVLAPAPQVGYRSGKALVYGFSATQGACNYSMWAFAANGNFVRLRLPSFCISNKPGDAEVQAGHKTEFDRQKQQVLQSITVL